MTLGKAKSAAQFGVPHQIRLQNIQNSTWHIHGNPISTTEKAFLYNADQRTELNPNEVPVQDQDSLNHLDYQAL